MTARVLRCIVALLCALCALPALAQGEAVTRYETDGVGNRTAMIRPNGERWEYGYDAANRLETVTSPEGAVTTYAYNRADHLIQTTDAEGRITQTPVDALGRVTRRIYANGDVETFDTYDASNNLTLRHDGNGQAIESTFDALERLTRRTYGGPAEPTDIVEESWEYDPDGQWTLGTQRAQDGTVYTTRRTYDRQSRLDDETDRYGQVTDHVYDPQDNRVGRTDPEGDTVFQPDRLNRLRSVQPENESALAIEYTPAGRIKTHTYPNGATSSHDYDIAGRVETITHRQEGVVTATFTYAYDLNGNRKTETHVAPLGTRTTTYVYDRDDRLTETHLTDEAGVVTDTIYTLDRVGNRKTEVLRQGATALANITYTYNERHQLTREVDSISNRTTTRLYDGNGFMTSETTNGQTTTYRPNLQDRLATLTTPTGPPVHYAYDLDGRRVEKRTTAEATRYGYDGTDLRRETNVVNNLLASYDWAGGRVLRTRRSNQTSYAQHDALKSPIRWSRADGGEQARATYSPWGELSAQTGVLPPIGYTGYYQDAESELLYAQQRYYAPRLGRFNRVDPWAGDPLHPITLNKYLYAVGSPLVYIDPDGRCPMALMVGECRELTAGMLWVDPYTREGNQAIDEFNLGSAKLEVSALSVVVAGGMLVNGVRAVASEVTRRGVVGAFLGNRQAAILIGGGLATDAAVIASGAEVPLNAPVAAGRRALSQSSKALDAELNAMQPMLRQADEVPSPVNMAQVRDVSRDAPTIGAPRSVAVGEGNGTGVPPAQMVLEPGKKPEVVLSDFLAGERVTDARRHAQRAVDDGCCVTGVIDRSGANARRAERLKSVQPRSGKDRDEFPPAVIKLDDPGAYSVEHVSPTPNRSSGSRLRHEIKPLPDGTRVRVEVPRDEEIP